MTKAESESLVRSYLDDPNSVRWDSTEFPLLMDAAYDSMWHRILNVYPWVLVATETGATVTSPGYVDLSALTQRFKNLIHVVVDEQQYGRANVKNITLQNGSVVVAEDQTYIRLGDQLHLFPYDTGADVEVKYGYIPAKWSSLSAGATVTWPDGHDLALVLGAVTRMMPKGAAEDVGQLGELAALEWNAMMDTLASWAPGGLAMFTNDTPEGWGSDSA